MTAPPRCPDCGAIMLMMVRTPNGKKTNWCPGCEPVIEWRASSELNQKESSMKKLSILILIVGLAFTVSGVTCMLNLQKNICNPPPAVLAVANATAPLISIAISMALPGSAVYVNAVSVMAAVTAIQGGVCLSLTQLNNLIAWLQSDEAKSLQTKAMYKAGPMKAQAVIDPAPLIAWRDKTTKR